ncbi:MAG TPA: hypothetical protein VMJ70_16260 [Candidatus Sulfotelmatobacter sp.]|nr:hypothetical protein [Candidatus Sulfotelmatobacter sp.]
MRLARPWFVLFTLAGSLSAGPTWAAWRHAPTVAPGGSAGVPLGAPFGWAFRLAHIGLTPRGPGNSERVRLDQGRRILEFPVGESALGLFVKVSGRVEFERADIAFADGSLKSVDAFGMQRSSGLYSLADFDHDREVSWVRLVLRARSSHARVGVLLGI